MLSVRARAIPILPLLFLLSCLAPTAWAGANAPTVVAPDSVLGTTVPFLLEDVDAETSATIHLDGQDVAVGLTGKTGAAKTIRNVTEGLHVWTVTVTDGTDVHTLRGHVHVQDALAGLTKNVTDLQTRVASLETALAALDGKVGPLTTTLQTHAAAPHPVVQTDLSAVQSDLSDLEAGVARLEASSTMVQQTLDADEPAPVASLADPVGRAGTFVNLLVVLGLGGLVAFTQWRAWKRQQEAMVLLLSMAARMNVTPDSEEFRSAVEALERYGLRS